MGRQGLSSQPPQMNQTGAKVAGPHQSKCGEQEQASSALHLGVVVATAAGLLCEQS